MMADSENDDDMMYNNSSSVYHQPEDATTTVSSDNGAEESNHSSNSSSDELSDTVLLSLIQSYDWPGTLTRINSHPAETCMTGVGGKPPLYVACENDAPAVVIQSLLSVYPEAASQTAKMNPLHITCSSVHASVHVVRVLLEGGHWKQCTMRDEDGDTPLHTACRCGASIQVLQVLLQACPTAVYERDYEGLTPLHRLWVRYFVIVGQDVIDSVSTAADLQGDYLQDAWAKTEVLLSAAQGGGATATATTAAVHVNNNNVPVFRAVHAAAAVDCPRAVVKIAAAVHPDQLSAVDENGMTPLLIAAVAPIFKVRDLSNDGYNDENDGDDNNGAAVGLDGWPADNTESSGNSSSSAQPSVIEILLQANQNAASAAACVPDPMGRLPLHWALATGKTLSQGVQALIDEYPEALLVPDVETKLFPFMLAAHADTDLNTLNGVLRLNPTSIGDLQKRRRRRNSKVEQRENEDPTIL